MTLVWLRCVFPPTYLKARTTTHNRPLVSDQLLRTWSADVSAYITLLYSTFKRTNPKTFRFSNNSKYKVHVFLAVRISNWLTSVSCVSLLFSVAGITTTTDANATTHVIDHDGYGGRTLLLLLKGVVVVALLLLLLLLLLLVSCPLLLL